MRSPRRNNIAPQLKENKKEEEASTTKQTCSIFGSRRKI